MSTAPYEPQTFQQETGSSGSGRCFIIGCLSVVGLMLLIGVCGGIGTYWFAQNQIAKYTSNQPADIPVVEMTDEEAEIIQTRIASFRSAIQEKETPGQLVLTANEINGMIANSKELKGKVFIRIENGQVSGDISMPIKDRYVNGSATFNVSLENGVLIVTLDEAEANGEPLPALLTEAIADTNLAADIYDNPEVASFLRNLDRIEVTDDTIILTPRQQTDQPSHDTTNDATSAETDAQNPAPESEIAQ